MHVLAGFGVKEQQMLSRRQMRFDFRSKTIIAGYGMANFIVYPFRLISNADQAATETDRIR